jgi:dTDP-4-dehydrorhamnose reductase
MKLLITGSNGLLGQKIVKQCLENGIDFLATSKGENRNPECPLEHYDSMNICDLDEIKDTINKYVPSHFIHTAALTNVDYCELNPEECHEVNVGAVEKLLILLSYSRGLNINEILDGIFPFSSRGKFAVLSMALRTA